MSFCALCGNDLSGQDVCSYCGARVVLDDIDNPYAVGSQTPPVVAADAWRAPEVPSFLRALQICLLEKYGSFKGRASRSEFWYFALGLTLLSVIFSFLGVLLSVSLDLDRSLLLIPLFIFALLVFLPTLGATIRRYHDVGLSGWIFFALYLLSASFAIFVAAENVAAVRAAPWLNAILGLVNLAVLCWPGTQGPNKYGPAPVKRAKK